MNEEPMQSLPPLDSPKPSRDQQTLGSSTLFRLCEEVISLRERNNRQPLAGPDPQDAQIEALYQQVAKASSALERSPDDPDFKPRYFGDLRARDAAYHQGTVWAWLVGPYIDAWLKVHPDDLAQLDALARRVLINTESEFILEFRILRHGEVRWIESRVLMSYDQTGRPVRRNWSRHSTKSKTATTSIASAKSARK